MTIAELFAELERQRVELSLDGDRLRFRAPTGALRPELRTVISDQRTEIIAALRPTPVAADAHSQPCDCERGDWRDDPPALGRIRTKCGRCGRFIGYRPTELIAH